MTRGRIGHGPAGWIAHWAATAPQRVALLAPDGTAWTYRDLYRMVGGFAAALRTMGAGPGSVVCTASGDPVGLRLLRWGGNVAGVVDALLDPALPTAEVAARAATVRAALVLSDADLAALCRAAKEDTAAESSFLPAGPDASTRVLFTTGSSGPARAVLQLAGHLDSAAESNRAGRGIVADDVLLCALPPHHAAGSLFEDTVLAAGGCLRLLPSPGSGGLAAALARGSGTITTVVPALLAGLDGDALATLRRLRLVNYAGEAISPELVRRIVEVYPGRLTRGYGLTEAGPLVSILPDSAHRGPTLPEPGDVGRPAPGVEVRIASGPGELQVRSPHVMAGYLNDPAATEERLRDGWLSTGDVARWCDTGLRLLGRLGNRIRSGGEWISLDGIQRCLAAAPGVADAAVVAVEHPRWGQRPVAFLQIRAGFSPEELRAHVSGTLARPSWPDWLGILDALPRTGHGKLDHSALRRLAADGPPPEAVDVRTPPPA
ncbi:long-chain fatty acid--CoA ligase [Actinoallomurus acanthiterrae]